MSVKVIVCEGGTQSVHSVRDNMADARDDAQKLAASGKTVRFDIDRGGRN